MINIRAKKLAILLVAVAALAVLPVYAQQVSTKKGEDVKEKISALSSNAESRAAAACALGQSGLPADDDAKARREAARSLGEIKDRRAVDHLINALKDNDSNVVLAVSWALGEIQGSQP